ncbi:MAG: class I SAM-dependent methyltransferase, partial [Gemmatimonadaceae bacterium]
WERLVTAVDWASLGIRCPHCLGAIDVSDPSQCQCAACSATYAVHFGIPDLRTGNDPYLSRAEDLAAATVLAELAMQMDFPSLLSSYYATNSKVPPAQVALFTRGTIAAGARAESTLAAWTRQDARLNHVPPNDSATVMDIGCGTAPLAIAAARRGFRAIGVDVGLRWLVLARKRALEAGVDIPLVCANVEALPFRDGIAARAGGESILENAADPEQALHELARVIRRGGRLWLTTPNKRSLGPDPHLGVVAGGWWPEAWLKRHALRTGKVFPRRTLFTGRALRRSLESADFTQITIALPDISATQATAQSFVMQVAIAGYHVVKRLPLAGRLLQTVAPTYLVTATRA